MINDVGNSAVTPIDVFVRIKRKASQLGEATQKLLVAQKLTELGIDPNSTRIHIKTKIPDRLFGNEILLKPGPGGLQKINLKV